MKTKFCSHCGTDTLHNPRGKSPKDATEFRCTQCGNPPRGANAQDKNKVLRRGFPPKVMWGAG